MHSKFCGRPKSTFVCKQCGTISVINYHSTNQFCSKQCAQVDCSQKVKKDEVWKKHKRAIANAAWQRYHAKQKQQTPFDADLVAIQRIYESCPPGHEVDHIVPISKGGLHHQDNLQHLTRRANRQKGNKMVGVEGFEPSISSSQN